MNRALVALLSLVAFLFASPSHAQPIIWQRATAETSFAQLIRDTSSNLYFVTRTSSFQRSRLNVTKYNAAGVEQWTQSLSNIDGVDDQFNIRSLALTSAHLGVIVQIRNGGGFGSLVRSSALSFNRADGSLVGAITTGASEYEAIAGSASEFAYLTRNNTTGAGLVVFANPVNMSTINTVSLGVVSRLGSIAMDTSSNAYAAYTVGGTGQVTKCSSSGAIAFDTVLDSPNHSSEVAEQIVVDSVGERAYVLGTGNWSSSPFDLDTLVSSVNTSTGALFGPTTALATNADDFPGGLLVLPNAGVILSAYTPATNTTRVRRFTKNGVYVWERAITAAGGGYERSQALDVDGNVLALTPVDGGNNMRISRIDVTGGALLSEMLVPTSGITTPLQIFTDSAGAAYVNHYDELGTRLSRIQHGSMDFLSNLCMGGVNATLRIIIGTIPTTNQVWTLSSSNTSVATVPSTATFTPGITILDVPVTTVPVAANTNVSINARNGGLIMQRTLTVLAPPLTEIAATPNSLIGGNNFFLTLTLAGAAPTGGRVINLSSSKPAVIALPASQTIPAGATSQGTNTPTFAVNTNQGVVLTATLGAVTKTVFVAVNAPSLTNLTVSPGTVQGGANSTLNLTINGIAPAGGFSITLISGAPGIVLLPASASVVAGLTTRALTFPTAAVTSTVNVTLFATRAGIYRTATLTVTP